MKDRKNILNSSYFSISKKNNRYFSLPDYYAKWLHILAENQQTKPLTAKTGITKFVIDALKSKNASIRYVFPKNIQLTKIKIYIPDFLYSSVELYAMRSNISSSRFIAYNVISHIDDICKHIGIPTPHDTFLSKTESDI